MSKPQETDEAARQFIDRMREIATRHGMGGNVPPKVYEQAVHDASQAIAPLAHSAGGRP